MKICEWGDVILRNFEEKDIKKKVEWINDEENNKFLYYDFPLKIDKTFQWFNNKNNNKRLDCIIEYKGISVGLIGLLEIDRVNSKAEYYITIGEKKYKNKGIATKATKAILNYAHSKLNLHKIYLVVNPENKEAINLYKKVGFEQEGYFADELYSARNLKFIDIERYAIILK